jgi:short subunit dehydrogenase-like uncharacterized protein
VSGRIVLFGATGYTGELTARAMVERGMKPVLAARRVDALDALADELGGLETAVADVGHPATVNALVERGDVLLSTVGPFARWGTPALETAIATGAHYLDSTGEPPFIRRAFEQAGPRAAAAGSLMLTACGYDWVPGNLAGALALREAGDAARGVRIGYFLTGGGLGGMSGGTRASAAGAFLEPQYSWRNGNIETERGASRVRSFDVRGEQEQALSVGTTEAFSLPRVYPKLETVDVYLGWFGSQTRAMQAISAGMAISTKLPGVRAGIGTVMGRFVKTSIGGPDDEARAGTGSLVIAEALSGSGAVINRVEIEGVNGYTFTGRFLAWAAGQIATGNATGVGARGPVEAFGLDALERGVAEAGLRRAAG